MEAYHCFRSDLQLRPRDTRVQTELDDQVDTVFVRVFWTCDAGAFAGGIFYLIAIIVGPVLIIPLAIVYTRQTGKTQRERFLKADLKTAQILGKEDFLSTLQKIDEMRLVDIEKNKVETARKRSLYTQGPTITQRIDNLLWGGHPPSSQID